jgi:spermidine synthase
MLKWQCITLGFYFVGTAVGAVMVRQGTAEKVMKSLVATILLSSVTALISIPIVYLTYIVGQHANVNREIAETFASSSSLLVPAYTWSVLFISVCEALAFIAGLLAGRELPLLLASTHEKNSSIVLGCSYFGALIGSLVYTLLLLPNMSMITIGCILSFFFSLMSLAFLHSIKSNKVRLYFTATSLACVVSSVLIFSFSDVFEAFSAKSRIHYQSSLIERPYSLLALPTVLSKEQEIETIVTPYQKIEMTDLRFPGRPSVFTMYLNGHFQLSSAMEKFYHEGMVHVSLAKAQHEPRNVLILGAGDGLLARELLSVKSVEKITLVELDEAMIKLARQHPKLVEMNENSLDNEKVTVYIEDAIHFLRSYKGAGFDTIFVDFPYPYNYDLSKLFSVEFYVWLQNAMNDDSLVVLNAPMFDNRLEEQVSAAQQKTNSIMISTLRAAGFETVHPYRAFVETFILASMNQRDLESNIHWKKSLPSLKGLSNDMIEDISNQVFPFNEKKALVNSVFKPTLGWSRYGFQ